MPFGDGTGPAGQGPMTGKAMGYCNGVNTPSYFNGGFARQERGFAQGAGRGLGRGMGRGLRRFQPAQPMQPQQQISQQPFTKQEEISYIKEQINLCKTEIEAFESRLNNLENIED